MLAAMIAINRTNAGWKNRDAPSLRMYGIHKLWMAALGACFHATSRLMIGIQRDDPDVIAQGHTLTRQGDRLISKTAREMSDLEALIVE